MKLVFCNKFYYTLILYLSMHLSMQLHAQVNITGNVKSESGKGIPNVHLLVYKPGFESILAFAISGSEGSFILKIQVDTDSLMIKTSSVQYKNESLIVKNQTQELNFILKSDIKQLEGVIVKTLAIEKYGDTLSYLVQSFANKNDRSVEDVLKRLPGITVESNGRILYQDIPINKLYVEGMDITSGNYGVVSKNLPQSSITTVEVFENHQPIKILQDVQFSPQAALNLKLKKKIAATGSIKAGFGVLPFLWQFNGTPFVFTKKSQWIISLQGNNIGENIAQQMLNFEDFNMLNFEAEPEKYLDLVSTKLPEIAANRYLNNKTFLFNLNSLHAIAKDVKLKTHVYLSDDKVSSISSETRIIYTTADTFSTNMTNQNSIHNQKLTTKFIVSQNAKHNYLNNEFVLELRTPYSFGIANFSNVKVTQIAENPSYRLSNSLHSIKPIGKKMFKLGSDFLYLDNPQSLSTTPVLFNDSIFENRHIDSLHQNLKSSKLFTTNYASVVLVYKAITIIPELGFFYKKTHLSSDLFMYTNNGISYSDSNNMNRVETGTFNPYLNTELSFKRLRYTLSFNAKLSNSTLVIDDYFELKSRQANLWLNEQKVSLNYKLGSFYLFYASTIHSKQTNDMSQYYPGYILKNFRVLSRNPIPISLTNMYRFNTSLSYRNHITSLFQTIDYTLSISESSYSNNRLESVNGTTQNDIISLFPGYSVLQVVGSNSSKYLSKLLTTFKLRFLLSQTKGITAVNNEKIITINRQMTITPRVIINATKWLSFDYGNTTIWFMDFVNFKNNNNVFLNKQNLSILIFPFKNQSIQFISEYYQYKKKDYFFADINYQYSFTKPRIDLQLKANNLFNTYSYISMSASEYIMWISRYKLKPFELLLVIRFTM